MVIYLSKDNVIITGFVTAAKIMPPMICHLTSIIAVTRIPPGTLENIDRDQICTMKINHIKVLQHPTADRWCQRL